jgi:hypothetical protein
LHDVAGAASRACICNIIGFSMGSFGAVNDHCVV